MKAHKENLYTYRITWSEEDKEFVGLCAEFPNLSRLAGSPVAAIKGIRELVADSIQELKRHDDCIPILFLSAVIFNF